MATLFPYLSPIPLDTDLQLFGFMTGFGFLGVYWGVLRRPFTFDATDLVLIVAGLFFLLYLHPSRWDQFGSEAKKSVAMLLGCSIFLAAKRAAQYFSLNAVCFAAIGHVLAAVLQSFLPDLHAALFSGFMGMIRTGADRGAGGTTNEPSFLANLSLVFPILAWILGERASEKARVKSMRICLVCTALLLALSQAGTGFVITIIVAVAYGVSRGVRATAITLSLVTMSVFGISTLASTLPSSRVTDLIVAATADPKIVFEDPSASMRLVGHYLSGPSLLERPLGSGRTGLDSTYFWYLWNRYNLDSWYNIELSRLASLHFALAFGLTDVGEGTMRMGWFFPVILLVWFSQYRGTRYSITVATFVVMGVLMAFPIMFPPYWLLLALIRLERSRETSGRAIVPNSSSLTSEA